jgi:hypothetical protein
VAFAGVVAGLVVVAGSFDSPLEKGQRHEICPRVSVDAGHLHSRKSDGRPRFRTRLDHGQTGELITELPKPDRNVAVALTAPPVQKSYVDPSAP